MDKFGVVTNDENVKTGAARGGSCPKCASTTVNYEGPVPFCRNCGTEPWEPHGQESSGEEPEGSHRK